MLAATRQAPADGSPHWSPRKLAGQLGVSHMRVARVWAKHGLKPHRLDRYLASNDPEFETKAADVIGLYLPPRSMRRGLVWMRRPRSRPWTVRSQGCPLSPGRAERQGFEYSRHGTLSLYAACNTKTGEVLGKTAPRHTSAEFVRVPDGPRRQPTAGARHPCERGQPLGAQDPTGHRVSADPRAGASALHAHVLVLAESGGTDGSPRLSAM